MCIQSYWTLSKSLPSSAFLIFQPPWKPGKSSCQEVHSFLPFLSLFKDANAAVQSHHCRLQCQRSPQSSQHLGIDVAMDHSPTLETTPDHPKKLNRKSTGIDQDRLARWDGDSHTVKKMVKQGNWDKTGWRSGGRLLCVCSML